MKAKIIYLVALFVLSLNSSRATDLSSFVHETQVVDNSNGVVTLIWWTPKSYWLTALKENKDITASAKDNLASTFDKYTVLIVCRAKMNSFGGFESINEEATESTITCTVNGEKFQFIPKAELDPDTASLFELTKPVLAQALGKFGTALEFYAFKNPYFRKGKLIEELSGRIEISAFDKSARFRLPLAAIFDPKKDPKTGDVFPGNYLYNPYTGEKLK